MTPISLWALRIGSLLAGMGIFASISYMEAQFYPVIDATHITQVSRSDRAIAIMGILHKQRNCTFVGVTAHGYFKGELVGDLNVAYARRDFNGTRGPGAYEWGPILITLPPYVADVDMIDLNALHDCHPVWMTKSHQASVPIPPY